MHRVTHRPALGLKLPDGYGAVEVETHQRFPQRLIGTMQMYDELTASRGASTAQFTVGSGRAADLRQPDRAASFGPS